MLFTNQIASIQETINYHQQQLHEAEEELYSLKVAEEYSVQAVAQVQEALENINPKYLELLKEELLSLFDLGKVSEEPPLEEKNISQPKIKIVERPDTTTVNELEKPKKTKAQLLGRRDLTPTSYQDLSPNIVYSSEGRCFIGFNDYKLAKDYGEKLKDYYEFSSGFIVDKPQFLMTSKWELKFWCSEENAGRLTALDFDKELEHPDNQKVIETWKYPLPKQEDDVKVKLSNDNSTTTEQDQLISISENIKYDTKTATAFIGMKSKGRARNYGDLLCFSYIISDKYLVSEKPTHFPEAKYELRLLGISKEDVEHLAKFNLAKDWNAKENEGLMLNWADRKKKPVGVTPPDKLYPLESLGLGDEVYRSPHRKQDRYLVIGMKRSDKGELFAECEVLHHQEFSTLIGQTVLLRECYLHQKAVSLPLTGEAETIISVA